MRHNRHHHWSPEQLHYILRLVIIYTLIQHTISKIYHVFIATLLELLAAGIIIDRIMVLYCPKFVEVFILDAGI